MRKQVKLQITVLGIAGLIGGASALTVQNALFGPTDDVATIEVVTQNMQAQIDAEAKKVADLNKALQDKDIELAEMATLMERREQAEREAAREIEKAEAAAKALARERAEQVRMSNYLAQLKAGVDDLNEMDLSANALKSAEDIRKALDIVEGMTVLYDKGFTMGFGKADKDLHVQLQATLIDEQQRIFPRLRDAFGPIMRAGLSGEGVSAVTTGEGYRSIRFTSEKFGDVAAVSDFHGQIHELLVRLRFSEASYMVSALDNEYALVEIKSMPDSQLTMNPLKHKVAMYH